MNFSKFDMTLLITMSIAVIGMSFVFPALGLTDAGTDENDVPEFSLETNRFDIIGDFPDEPGTPSRGELWWDGSEGGSFSENQIWLEGDTSGGIELTLVPNQGSSKDPHVEITNWTDGSITGSDNFTFNSSGEQGYISNSGYGLRLLVTQYETDANGNLDITVEYEIDEQPTTDGGWIGRLPIIGGVFDTAEALPSTVAWIGSIFWWFFGTLFEVTLNIAGILYDVTSYLIDTAMWLINTYSDVITGASSWASVFVAIPGIILSLVLSKLAVIGVSLLPTT